MMLSSSIAHAQTSAEPGVLIEQPLFTDDLQWEALVRVDLDMQDAEQIAESIGRLAETSAGDVQRSAGTFSRASIDVDLVTAIITERAQQVGMRAIADAIRAIGGPGADRIYVRDVLEVTRALLMESGGLQRTHVEQLVQVLTRVVLSEALVRTRFPRTRRLNQADYWERRLCRAGRGTRAAISGSDEHCDRIRFGFPSEEVDSTTLHLYLIDLAYWRLGASGFFPEAPRPPTCPFPLGAAGHTLCQAISQAGTDQERNARVDWLLNLDRVLDGLLLARSLQPLWNSRGVGAQGLLRTLHNSQAIGAFGRTVGLRTDDWENLEAIVAALGLIRELGGFTRDFLAINPRVEMGAELDEDGLRLYASISGRARALRERIEEVRLCRDIENNDTTPALCRHAAVLGRWLGEVAAPEARDDAETQLQKFPAPPAEIVELLDSLRRQLTRLEDAFGATAGDGSAGATLDLRLSESILALSDRVWDSASTVGEVRRLGELRLTELDSVLHGLQGLVEVANQATRALDVLSRDLWDWRQHPSFQTVRQTLSTLSGALRLLRLLSTVNVHAAREARLSTVSGALSGMASLGNRGRGDSVHGWLLHFLEPVLPYVVEGRAFDTPLLFQLLARIDSRDLLRAMGFDTRSIDACQARPSSLACWMVRITQALREATHISQEGVRVDGDRFRATLATLGDDFRRRHQWRTYFHLTIGLGQIGVLNPPGSASSRELEFAPLVAEQIGIGMASPSFLGDRLTFRFGLYGSGLLYRAVLDSEESDSVMFGGFAALDLYELLEVYVAPTLILYPSTDERSAQTRFALTFGAQVPLGDYLSRL